MQLNMQCNFQWALHLSYEVLHTLELNFLLGTLSFFLPIFTEIRFVYAQY